MSKQQEWLFQNSFPHSNNHVELFLKYFLPIQADVESATARGGTKLTALSSRADLHFLSVNFKLIIVRAPRAHVLERSALDPLQILPIIRKVFYFKSGKGQESF